MIQPYPRLPGFNYHCPKTTADALHLLEKFPEQSRPYAGGTDCFVQIRDRRYLPEHMIDLKSIPELAEIHFDTSFGFKIGATASLNALIRFPQAEALYPVLVAAARDVAGYQLRTRATVVGNICNASPCGDTIGPCMVYGGQMHLISTHGERNVALADFFTGPGKTVLQKGEFAAAITLPIPVVGTQGSYQSIGRNKMGDLAIAAVTILGYPDKECASGYKFRIALTAVAPTVIFAQQAEEMLCAQKITTSVLKKAVSLCSDASKPITDIRASAAYRKEMIQTLAQRGLEETCEKLGIVL